MSSPYANKIVLITGASSGIGKSTAMMLASKGAQAVTLFSRTEANLKAVQAEIQAAYPNCKTLVVAGDASKAEDNQRAVDETVAAFGGITGVFINAGNFHGGKPIHEIDDASIEDTLNVNVKGVIYGLRAVIPAIQKTVGTSGPTGSVVVNSSCMGLAVIGPKSAGAGIYSASKAFVNSLVETAAIENAPRIRVNGVMPGVVKTGIMPVDDATYEHIASKMQPLWGRAGLPNELATLVSYLMSDEASFISGSNIKADGLWSLSGGIMG